MSQPEQSVDDLLSELNAEFGKKPKGKDPNAEVKKRNREWHERNPQVVKGAVSYAKAQLENAAFRNYYDWENHRIRLLEEARREAQGSGSGELPDLEWYPEARVTFIIRQRCGCCNSTTEFIGSEYIRFRGRRRTFYELGGGEHEMVPTVLQRVDKVDPNLLAFGMPGGEPLPDLLEEQDETVRRCVGCIMVEQKALDIWVQAVQPTPQAQLPGFDEVINGL